VEDDPVKMDMEKGSKWSVTPIENLPPSSIVELVGLDPAIFPNPEFRDETSGKIKGRVMWYGEGPASRNLGLLIDKKELGKRIDVILTPVFRFDPQAKDTMAAQKLTKRFLPQQLSLLDLNLKNLTLQSTAIDNSKDIKDDEKAQKKNLINLDLKNVQEQLARFNSAKALVEKAQESATIHIRVSYDTGVGKVILAQSTGAPPAEPLGKKQEAKK